MKNTIKTTKKYKAAALYFDFSPLRGPRYVQKSIAEAVQCPCFTVDTHNCIPVWITSDTQEYAARTIRIKINRMLGTYLVEPKAIAKHPYSLEKSPPAIDWSALENAITAPKLKQYKPYVDPGSKSCISPIIIIYP